MSFINLMEKCLKKFREWTPVKQDIFIITITYVCSQGCLFLLTGKWIDDWAPYWEEDVMREIFAMSGFGEPMILIKKLGYFFPGNGYLVLVFLLFLASSLSLYGVLHTANGLSRQ